MFSRVVRKIVFVLFGLLLAAVVLVVGAYIYVAPELPSVADLKNIRLQTPLRVYTRNARLIGEFGEKRRIPVAMAQVPPLMVDAFLASEDDRFFEHPGVDYEGLLRAAAKLVETGEKKQGGSTITMQLARNYFLTSERTYKRKIKEIFLALLIERRFGKNEILELYLNKIFLGHRAYGVGAAAEVYYGAGVQDLELAQIAMIAGLPKAPSIYNPLSNPALALKRRDYVLDRMLELKKITPSEHAAAVGEGITAKRHRAAVEVEAPYVAEMARQEAVERFGDEAYIGGYEIYTTLDGELQTAADRAVRKALIEYDVRHGYRGSEARLGSDAVAGKKEAVAALEDFRELGGLLPAVVTEVRKSTFSVIARNGAEIALESSAYSWARRYIDHDRRGVSPGAAGDVVSAGDVVRVVKGKDGWKLRQLPNVGGALVALDADTGAIISLSGGFDFALSKFNRAVQARRQPGSSFKPFIYSAALAHGYTPATIVNDSPIVFTDVRTSLDWRPANYSGKFFGPTRLREALKHSRNLVSIRLVDGMSVRQTLDYILRFGFERSDQPYNLTLALGSGTVTPLDMASAFTVFANGGAQTTPYLIDEIRTADGRIHKAEPPDICAENCDPQQSDALDLAVALDAPSTQTSPPSDYVERVIPSDVTYQVNSMLRDVIRGGTGRRARVLGRSDLAGKTGTTNDQRDAWFSGFNRDVVCTTWVGFDDHAPLGRYETGSRAALPMWIEFMKTALENKPERPYFKPANIVTARIDPETGLLAHPRAEDTIIETFRSEYLPKEVAGVSSSAEDEKQKPIEKIF